MESKHFLIHKVKRLIESPIVVLRLVRPAILFWRILHLRLTVRLHGGSVVIGKGVRVDHPTLFQGRGKLVLRNGVSLGFGLAGAKKTPILLQSREVDSEIVFGENSAVMNGCELIARKSISIGENTRIGPHTLIYDSDFHDVDPGLRHQPGKTEPVIIESNVWIGSRAIILKGVRIGKDAVIAAGCVVTKDVSAGSVVAGNPMQVVGDVYANKK